MFTPIITTRTVLIQRETREFQYRGPHCTQTSNHHLTPRHEHIAYIRTCSSCSRNITLSTLQNSTFCKKKSKTSIQQHALKIFIEIDSFQDPKSDLYGKTSGIDFLQDPYIMDSFQDPYILTHFKSPSIVY